MSERWPQSTVENPLGLNREELPAARAIGVGGTGMSSGRQRLFLNGVSVVLSGDAETFRGASIAWATKVERDHAMVSLPGHAAVTECIRNAAEFTINVLAAEQSHIARQYGGSSQTDPLEIQRGDLDFELWNIPVVKGARAQLLCKLRHAIVVREQLVVIAEIANFAFDDSRQPLVYFHDQYFAG